MKFIIYSLGLGLLMTSCTPKETQVNNPYEFVQPSHFPPPTYSFDNNPITEKGFKLGRKLFNDPILSLDQSIACSNCHSKSVAFADPQHRLSVGIDDKVGIRNSPALANLAFMDAFFWDGGVTHLDFVPINAIESDFEMGERLQHVVAKLNQHREYPALFESAFEGTDSINAPLLLHALSQYLNLLVSADSKYDRYIKKEENLSESELAGLVLFEQKCSSCHEGVLFTDQTFRNNGLDTEFSDQGRAVISEGEEDKGKFRVPSLRNVALTRPYMHDGRFQTLEAVLEHYNTGVKWSATLDPVLQEGSTLGLTLTAQEQTQILDFLHTLTDRSFIADEIF